MGKFAKPARNVRTARDPEDVRFAVALAELLGESHARDRGHLVVGDQKAGRFGGDGQRDRDVGRLDNGPAAIA